VSEPTKIWPQKELGKKLSNWGRWGEDDEVGTLNFVTPEKIAAASRLVQKGMVFDLGMPFDAKGPQSGAGLRFNPIHMMSFTPMDTWGSPDGFIAADDIVIMGLQCATQWDALCHIGYDGLLYNNTPASAVNSLHGATRNAFSKCVDKLVSRGVLLDIARLKGIDRLEDSTEITSEDLSAAEAAQGVKVESGDILLVRTGTYQWFLEGNAERFMGPEPGLGLSTAEWLYERQVAAVALDNWAVEVWPSKIEGSTIPFHMVAIRDMGLTLGEMFNLEELSTDCSKDGVWEFLFTGGGLKISNSAGSPATPLVLK
jgi:kynurenine formamidase